MRARKEGTDLPEDRELGGRSHSLFVRTCTYQVCEAAESLFFGLEDIAGKGVIRKKHKDNPHFSSIMLSLICHQCFVW